MSLISPKVVTGLMGLIFLQHLDHLVMIFNSLYLSLVSHMCACIFFCFVLVSDLCACICLLSFKVELNIFGLSDRYYLLDSINLLTKYKTSDMLWLKS